MNSKLSDTLICVNNDLAENGLTVGKEYKVVDERSDNYRIINDKGQKACYFKCRFKLKEEKEDMSNTFNLEDLKTGQRITFENGDKYIVFKDTPHDYNIVSFVVEDRGNIWACLSCININKIVKVENPAHPFTLLKKPGYEDKYTIIWERPTIETPEQAKQRELREQYEATKKQLEELGKQLGIEN